MTRFELGGQGDPITQIAFPTNETDDIGGFWVVLREDAVFRKREWLDQGFTNFDVYCIGAAGGRGGDGYPAVSWPYVDINGVRHWRDPFLANMIGQRRPYSYGGGGGGGGLQHIQGVLDQLPDEVIVTVGQAGQDAGPGYIGNNVDIQDTTGYHDEPYASQPSVIAPGDVNDAPGATFYPPQVGSDGEPTTFGDLANASGGKGGQPTPLRYNRRGTNLVLGYGIRPGGDGGQGGIGGRAQAGGGGLGAVSSLPLDQHTDSTVGSWHEWYNYALTEAADGQWNGQIGQGGGGGRGGTYIEAPDNVEVGV